MFGEQTPEIVDILTKLGLAVLLAGAMGLERQRKGRPAGIRTHILVCLGATLLMIVSDAIALQWIEQGAPVWLDRGRVAAGIVTGVGFLGAGTIINFGREQHGLTTAAMIWFVAALGISIGSDMYLLSVLATAVALAVVVGLGTLEGVLPSRAFYTILLHLKPEDADVDAIEAKANEQEGILVSATRIVFGQTTGHVELTLRVKATSQADFGRLLAFLRAEFDSAPLVDLQRLS